MLLKKRCHTLSNEFEHNFDYNYDDVEVFCYFFFTVIYEYDYFF